MPEATESDQIPNGPSSNSNNSNSNSNSNMLAENFFNSGGTALTLPLPLALPMAMPMPVASRKDVDFLVQEIKENLKLGHNLKSRSSALSHRASHRASPYPRVPNPSRQCDAGGAMSGLRKWTHRRRYPSTCMNNAGSITGITGASNANLKSAMAKKAETDDPFEMLQELISDGSLIKEAVRRLQMGLAPKYSNKRDYYDSDEDCRTPTAVYQDLCCEVAGI